MERTKWIECFPNNYMAFVNDYVLGVELKDDGLWHWDVWYCQQIVADACDTERGAKTAASRWARRKT